MREQQLQAMRPSLLCLCPKGKVAGLLCSHVVVRSSDMQTWRRFDCVCPWLPMVCHTFGHGMCYTAASLSKMLAAMSSNISATHVLSFADVSM